MVGDQGTALPLHVLAACDGVDEPRVQLDGAITLHCALFGPRAPLVMPIGQE